MYNNTLIYRIALSLLCLAFLASPLHADDQQHRVTAPVPLHEEPGFNAAMRDWLLANPEILLEMAAKLDERREARRMAGDKALIDANHEALFADPRDGRIGDGTPAFVEFVDYNCGFCKQNHPDVKAWHEAHPDSTIIIKEFPILGPGSEAAARAVLAVKSLHGIRAYQAIHNAFLELEDQLDEASIEALFAEFAIDEDWDVVAIKAEMESDAITAQINDTRALADALGITGTPGFVFWSSTGRASIGRGLMSLEQIEMAVARPEKKNGDMP